MTKLEKKTLATIGVVVGLSISIHAAQRINVKIVDRQNSSTRYTYVLPGYLNMNTTSAANCLGNAVGVNCAGTSNTTGLTIPARVGSYDVQGATIALQLPDGRVAVVNCQSKYKPKGDWVNRRSCREPLVDSIQVEFNGDKAKLWWPVSIDGKKLQSETYKILAVLDKP